MAKGERLSATSEPGDVQIFYSRTEIQPTRLLQAISEQIRKAVQANGRHFPIRWTPKPCWPVAQNGFLRKRWAGFFPNARRARVMFFAARHPAESPAGVSQAICCFASQAEQRDAKPNASGKALETPPLGRNDTASAISMWPTMPTCPAMVTRSPTACCRDAGLRHDD